jgi:hypothetical protein
MLVVAFCTILYITIKKFIFSADYATARFHLPGVVAPVHCPINLENPGADDPCGQVDLTP